MTNGSQRRQGGTSTAVLWLLLAVLVGGGIVAWLFLFADSQTTVGPVVSSPPDPVSGSQIPVDSSPPDPATVPENPVPDPTSVHRQPVEVDGGNPFRVRGYVRDAETRQPVPVFEVYLAPGVDGDPRRLPETLRPHHVRNLEGWFQVAPSSAGKHQLLIRSKTHEDLVQRVALPLEDPLDLFLGRGAWITGTVRDDRGNPKPHVNLWLRPQGGSLDGTVRDVARTSSDKEGIFAFYKLTPGTYKLVAGTLTAPLDVREELRVQAGQRVEESLVVPRLTTLLIQVQGAEGQPLPDARVTLLTIAGEVVRTAFTDADGTARLASARQGRHLLQIRATGFVPLEEQVDVSVAQPEMEIRRTLAR